MAGGNLVSLIPDVTTRENIPVEIALLVSLLLHVFAFGSWQYRDTLMKMPILSSVAKLLQAAHLPALSTSRPQTITFVEVEEPRAKAASEKRREEARRFMETDASQITGEKPKDAKYYSDKSTVAANPQNPTGKEGDTPYLEGKETRAPGTIDVPTPSGMSQPLIVQPGSPGVAASAAKPAPAVPPQVARSIPPKPTPPAQPKEVAPQGLKIVEEQKLAMAPKPAVQPEIVENTSAAASSPAAAAPGAPAVASVVTEPGVPGRELVVRKAKLMATGISRTGVAAFNVAESPFGAYDKKIIRAVQSRWYALIDRFGMYERAGQVTVHFELLDDGQVQEMKVTENTAGQILALFCEKAIIESGPFDPLPDQLRALVGKEPREASFTFYY
jgi:hypothetical protein